MTSREEVARRVDELARLYSGRPFADAVRAYSGALDEDSREQLRHVLLERAGGVDQALMERVDARGWFRRQWDKASQTPPRRRGR
jgi:hypothetical protein